MPADSPASTPVLEPLTMGPWDPESLDLLMGLSGETGTAERLTAEGTEYYWFEWSTPVKFFDMTVWLFILANEDPTPEDPAQWAWHIEVRTDEDFEQGRGLASNKSRTRAEAVTLACELLNVFTILKPGVEIHANG